MSLFNYIVGSYTYTHEYTFITHDLVAVKIKAQLFENLFYKTLYFKIPEHAIIFRNIVLISAI